MFAVTQEDFMHPMAVIELLWRSCCASKSEKQDVTLLARLKVRQRTQMLVDHSLLQLAEGGGTCTVHDLQLDCLRLRLACSATVRWLQTTVGRLRDWLLSWSALDALAADLGRRLVKETSNIQARERCRKFRLKKGRRVCYPLRNSLGAIQFKNQSPNDQLLSSSSLAGSISVQRSKPVSACLAPA